MGEKPNGRELIDKQVKSLVERGAPADWAKKRVTDARIRNEQREEGRKR
jgi:hypothetical protein